MIVKTPGSQMGSPAAAEEGGGEAMGGGRGESGERSEVQARLTLKPMAPKARSRSREVATLDEAPKDFFFWFGILIASLPSTAETHTDGGAVLGIPEGSPARRHSRAAILF